MAFEYDLESESFIASGDLSGLQHRIVDLLSTDHKVGVAGAAGGWGVLQNKPKDGEHATVGVEGVTLVRVGGAVTAGQYCTSAASGWGTTVTSGAGQTVLGRYLTTAASGMLAALELNRFYRPNSVGN